MLGLGKISDSQASTLILLPEFSDIPQAFPTDIAYSPRHEPSSLLVRPLRMHANKNRIGVGLAKGI